MTRSIIRHDFVGYAAVALSTLSLACAGTDGRSGVEEPFVVQDGQFVEGDLPGVKREDAGDQTGPTVTSASSTIAVLRERLSGVGFFGLSSLDASAVGVQFEGLGSGYYLFPTGAVDSQDPRSLSWSFNADFNASLPAGRHQLLTVAFDKDGKPGIQASASLCIRSLLPDNGNSCFPQIAPPFLVVSAEWDTPVDFDLLVITPSGIVISAKNPIGDQAGQDVNDPSLGRIAYDGNVNCQVDGRQREDIVFEALPEPGTYKIYVNLARNCGEASVNYEVSRHVQRSLPDNEYGVSSSNVGAGTLIADQAKGGTSLGTFVAEFKVN